MIWEWDHVRPCSIEEWHYWMLHPLPFGWGLLSKPIPLSEEATNRGLDNRS